MAKKTYKIGEATERYLNALDAFARFKTVFFDALTEEYGEKAGEEMFSKHAEQFDAVEFAVLDYMRVQFGMEMGTDATEITI